MRAAVVLSLLVHSAAFLVTLPFAKLLPVPPESASEEDRWTGNSIEVSLVGMGALDTPPGAFNGVANPPSATTSSGDTSSPPGISSPTPPSGSTPPPGGPSSSALNRPPPSGPVASSSASSHPVASSAPTPRVPPVAHKKPSKKASSPNTNTAETKPKKSFHLPKTPKKPTSSSAAPAPSAAAPTTADTGTGAAATPATSGTAATATGTAAAATPATSGTAAAGTAGTFGSEGSASVRDLGRAFTRAIPAACSADPVWAKLTAGAAGTLTALLQIDAEGHITSAEPVGLDPPKALTNVLKRTVLLLQSGTFSVRPGAVTAGTETIELTAHITDEQVAPEEGAADSLGFEYKEGRGKASFTQTGGRHVDITVRVVRTTVSP